MLSLAFIAFFGPSCLCRLGNVIKQFTRLAGSAGAPARVRHFDVQRSAGPAWPVFGVGSGRGPLSPRLFSDILDSIVVKRHGGIGFYFFLKMYVVSACNKADFRTAALCSLRRFGRVSSPTCKRLRMTESRKTNPPPLIRWTGFS